MRLFKSIENNTNKKKKVEPPPKQKHSYDFLVVDDSRFSRSILTDILKSEGYNIVGQAGDGQEAIELTREKKPSFIFMDITMPKMDGLTAAKEILQEFPHINIIMCSALSQKKVIVDAIKSGAKDFVIKPYKKENIISVVDLHIEAEKKGQVIPFRSDNHIKKSKENDLDIRTAQPKEERDLSLDDMISKEVDIIFDSYQDEDNKIDLANEPKLEVVKKSDDKDTETLVVADEEIESLDIIDEESEALEITDEDTETVDTADEETEALDTADDQIETPPSLEVDIDTDTSEDPVDLGQAFSQFDQFLENFGSSGNEASLMSQETEEDEEGIEDEGELTLGIDDDDSTHAMYSFDGLPDPAPMGAEDIVGEIETLVSNDTNEDMESSIEAETLISDDTKEDMESSIETETLISDDTKEDMESSIETETLISDDTFDNEVTEETDGILLDDSKSSVDTQGGQELRQVTIPEPLVSQPRQVDQHKTIASVYANRFVEQPQAVKPDKKVGIKISRVGVSQLLNKPHEIEQNLDYDIETLYNILSAYICLNNRFSNKNMQFELINEVKSHKKILADSLNKDTTKKKSISMLNVYRKDIYKKEKTEEKIDEGLLAAVTSLVRSKGTRILGNNKFDI